MIDKMKQNEIFKLFPTTYKRDKLKQPLTF